MHIWNQKRIPGVYYAESEDAFRSNKVGGCLFFGNLSKKKDFHGRMLYIYYYRLTRLRGFCMFGHICFFAKTVGFLQESRIF